MLDDYLATLPYEIEIKHLKRGRMYRLGAYIGGQLSLSIPRHGTERGALRFLKEKESWIHDVLAQKNGGMWNKDLQTISSEHFKEYKEDALQLVKERVRKYNQEGRFTYENIRVKRMKTQWGSCSSIGNLNFNYKILFLPEHLQDYLVVHELSHLVHHNHSREFWSLVESLFPNAKHADKELLLMS